MLIILTSQKKHPYFSNVESEREICTGFEKKNDARARGKETYLILEYHSCIVIAHYYLSRSVSRYVLMCLRSSRVIIYTEESRQLKHRFFFFYDASVGGGASVNINNS
jgi:hypothetical protein